MKYLVVRMKDERSSDLCKDIETLSIQNGGLEFPFQHKGYYFDSSNLNRGLSSVGNIHTGTFHENCRCSLVPISNDSFMRYREPDDLDMEMMIDGAIGYSNAQDLPMAEGVEPASAAKFSENKIFLAVKNFIGRFIKTRKSPV